MEENRVSEPPVEYDSEVSTPSGLENFFMYQESLRRRLITATSALNSDSVPYAVIGGVAVAHYVGLSAPGLVRSTRDVDLVMNESEIPAAKICLAKVGFKYHHAAGVDMFLDTGSAHEGVHVIMAGKKVRPEYASPAPDLSEIERSPEGYAVIPFHKLVEMKLNSYRTKDRTHLYDMINAGLLPGDVMATLPEALRPRLQVLLDNPES